MKIVLFDYVFERDNPGVSGLSDIVWNWATHLTALGDEVHIVAPYLPDVQPPAGVFVHRFEPLPLAYRNVVGHIALILQGWREIRKIGPVDIIQAPEYLSTGIYGLLIKNTPVILRVPGNIYERIEHGNPFDGVMTFVLKIAAALSALHCACIITTTKEMCIWWAKTGTPVTRMVLLPTGVDILTFHPVSRARSSLGFPLEKRMILYVGRLSREKGLMQLLEALSQLISVMPNVQLHLVGDGPLKGELQRLVQQSHLEEHVVFHGWIAKLKLPLYYSSADVTVLPSLSEGLPRTMLEALACGSPFVGTTITGIVDHIVDNENGLLVPPGDISALAQALQRILSDPALAQMLGTAAYAYAQQHLDWKVIVRRMKKEVYESVACQ